MAGSIDLFATHSHSHSHSFVMLVMLCQNPSHPDKNKTFPTSTSIFAYFLTPSSAQQGSASRAFKYSTRGTKTLGWAVQYVGTASPGIRNWDKQSRSRCSNFRLPYHKLPFPRPCFAVIRDEPFDDSRFRIWRAGHGTKFESPPSPTVHPIDAICIPTFRMACHIQAL